MKSLTNSQKALILGLIGVVAAVLGIMYVAMPNYSSTQSIKSENATLQNRLTELQGKQAKRDQYLAETEEYEGKFNEILDAFPNDLNQEISIMFVQGIKEDYDFTVNSLGLGEKEQFYTLGQGGADTALADGSTDGTTTEATTEASTEATTEAAATDTAESSENGASDLTDTSGYLCYRAAFPISYEGTYSAVKDIVSYVDNNADRMVVDSIDIAYDAESDLYTGSMNLMCYAIESQDRPERAITLDEVETGVENVFTGDGASSSGSDESLNKYDENDGAAIVSSYDFYAMINAADSDVSAKVVGQNGAGKDASVVSNSDNSVSALSFNFYEKDGKNYCDYDLDGTKYTAEVTSAEDIKLLLQSSAKKNEDDKSGVRVTINNTSSLPVYVKIADDDAASGRVNIASKSGSVKVYK